MGTRRPTNAWVSDEELDRAADTVRRLSSPTHGAGAARAAGEEVPVPAALISTAAGYTIGEPPVGRLIRPNQTDGWDKEVWSYYDCVGELHYVANQYARAVSRARFFIAKLNDEGAPEEVKDGEAGRINRELLGGETGQSEVLYVSAIQQFMSGQSLITVTEDKETGGTEWNAYSDQDFDVTSASMRNVRGATSPYKVDLGTGRREPLAPGTLTIHMWDRHPGRAAAVDSSVRPALPYLRELARLDQYVQSILLSRIALAGILKLPPGTQVMVPPQFGPVPEGISGIMHVLAMVGTTNITNPGTAAAALPVLLQMSNPDQDIEHITLDQPLTDQINALREINLKRLAMSLDLAPEAMSGFSDVKYSNADWIKDESVQTHIARRVDAFKAALTRWYAVPALSDEFFVAADLSDLESDEDRTDAALGLYDRGEIDGKALRQLANMRDAQPPDGQELLRQLAVRAVTTNPSLFPVLAPLLGLRDTITLTPEQEQALEESGGGDSGLEPQPIPNPAPPALEDPDDTGPPPVRQPQRIVSNAAVSDALVAACDVVVSAALSAAGSKWRRRRRPRAAECRGTDPHAIYLVHPLTADRTPQETAHEHAAALIADRWTQVPRIAALHRADPACLQATLADYVAGLIADQRPHHPDTLAEVVTDCVGECVAC